MMAMQVKPLIYAILHDDHLTRGLGDAEARLLVEWLVERVEEMADDFVSAEELRQEVQAMCSQTRRISRFVRLWCLEDQPAAAYQLAATERFAWPLPTGPMDPFDLLQSILAWEAEQRGTQRQVQGNLAG